MTPILSIWLTKQKAEPVARMKAKGVTTLDSFCVKSHAANKYKLPQDRACLWNEGIGTHTYVQGMNVYVPMGGPEIADDAKAMCRNVTWAMSVVTKL